MIVWILRVFTSGLFGPGKLMTYKHTKTVFLLVQWHSRRVQSRGPIIGLFSRIIQSIITLVNYKYRSLCLCA